VPRVIVDASKAQQGEFKKYEGPLPPNGKYKAVLKSAWWGMSKGGNGKEPCPMLTVIWEFKAKAVEKQRYDGFAMFQRITHQDSTLWRMQELFAALGQPAKSGINVTEKDGPFGKVVTQIGRANVGKVEALITTKTEMYEGSERRGVQTLAPLPGVVVEEFDEGDETSYEDAHSMTEQWEAEANSAPGVDASDEKWDAQDDVPF
jgi:hypothetical protein